MYVSTALYAMCTDTDQWGWNMQTSIMAVQFKDGVVVGADSRTTTGSYIVCVPQIP